MSDDGDEEQEDTRRTKDRSEKFRSRLSGQREQGEQRPQAEQTTQEDVEDEAAQRTQREQAEQTPVTDRRHATFYLAEDLHKRLDRGGKRVSLDYEMEFDAELGKNRYLRPLMLYLGLERLQEMDPEEIRNILDETGVLDDAPE